MKKIFYLTIVSFLTLQTMAYAEWIKGTVLGIDEQNKKILIKRSNEMQDYNKNLPPQVLDRLDLKVSDNADFKNMSSLKDLEPGQEVRVNIRQNPQNPEATVWEATSIEYTPDQPKEFKGNLGNMKSSSSADTNVDVRNNADGSTSVDIDKR